MAASHLIVTVGHGLIRLSRQLQEDAPFRYVARLQLVRVTNATPAKRRADWRGLKGNLVHPTIDQNLELSHERMRELESEKVRLKRQAC